MIDPYEAARAGDLDALRSYAVTGDLDVRGAAELRRTPLHVAIESGQAGAARLLIELGADIRSEDYRGARPLHVAAGMGLLEIVELLLTCGAEPGALDVFGMTALHRLAAGGGTSSQDDQVAVARLLMTAGVGVDAIGNAGRTPLWCAAARGKAKLCLALLKAGADPARRADGTQGSPADAAAGEAVRVFRRR